MADTRTPASRRAAPTGSASRLPSARERRPALAALAVLLIVGGAFASGFLALQAGNRADYLRVKADVDIPQGAEITSESLESVSLPEDMDGVISVDDEEDVVGYRAAAHLLEGTILTPEMVTEEEGIGADEVEVPFGVELDNIAPDLDSGDFVRVFAVSEEGQTIPLQATVVDVDYPSDDGGIGGSGGSGSTVQVIVLMSASDAEELQPAIDDDRISSVGRIEPPPSVEGEEEEGSDDQASNGGE